MKKLVVVTALSVGAAALAAAGVRAQDTAQTEALADTRSLEAVRAELEQRRAALHDLDNKERSLLDSMGQLDEALAALEDRHRAAQQRLDTLLRQRRDLERSTGLDEDELTALRTRLQARLRVLEVSGEGGTLRALLGAEGFTELALRRRFLQRLAQSDARLVADVRRVEASVRDKRRQLRDKASEAAALADALEQERQLVQATRQERAATLGHIRDEKELFRRATEELLLRRRDLVDLLRKLEEGPRYVPPSGRKGMLRDGLPWPVDGGVVIRHFGSVVDRDNRAELVSNGVELRAEAGSAVHAVAAGRVVHTGWLRGFGRIVIVDHGEGHHTLCAHLSEIRVATGDTVERGQELGAVGDTESDNGPKLYFELRENGRPRDPAPFFR